MQDLFLCGMHEVTEGLLLSFAPTWLGHIESFFLWLLCEKSELLDD